MSTNVIIRDNCWLGQITGKKVKPVEGFVAYIDILGYKTIMQQKPEMQIEVLQFLTLATKQDKTFKCHGQKIDMNVISDTIIVFLPTRKSDPCYLFEMFFSFVWFLNCLQYTLFDNGLPVRGAICFGTTLKIGSTFSGESLLRVHNLANSLEFSGIVFTPQMEHMTSSFIIKHEATKSLFYNEMVMRHTGAIQKYYTADLLCLDLVFAMGFDPIKDATDDDLRRYVYEKFTSYGKTAGAGSIIEKMKNTVALLREAINRRLGS